MTEKTDSEKIDEMYYALRGNPDMGVKSPFDRLFEIGENLQKKVEDLDNRVSVHDERWRWLKWALGFGGTTGLSGFGLWIKSHFGG